MSKKNNKTNTNEDKLTELRSIIPAIESITIKVDPDTANGIANIEIANKKINDMIDKLKQQQNKANTTNS